MKKTSLALALLATAAAAAAPSPASAAGKAPRCQPSHSTTLEISKTIRVYSVPKRGDYDQAYACLLKTGKRVLLANSEECMGTFEATNFQLAGNFVAWVRVSCGLTEGDADVVVTDVAKRKTKYLAAGAAPTAPGATVANANTFVSDLKVSPTGSAAWIGSYSSETAPAPPDSRQVRKLEPDAPEGGTLVDSGPEIVQGSLALAKDGFYYRKGAQAIFTPLG